MGSTLRGRGAYAPAATGAGKKALAARYATLDSPPSRLEGWRGATIAIDECRSAGVNAQRSLRQALAHTVELQQLVSNSGRFVTERDTNNGVQLVYHVAPSPVAMYPAQIDSLFAAYMRLLYSCMPADRRPIRVELPGTESGLADHYQTYFECPVILGVEHARVSFRAELLDFPWQAADPTLLRIVLGRAEMMLKTQGRSDTLVDYATAAIAAQGLFEANCDNVARSLDLSRRTLQRRLAQRGSSFRQLLETVRMSEALEGLADPDLPLVILAERQDTLTVTADMGYSNGQRFQVCEEASITVYVPPNRTSNPGGERQDFTYEAEQDRYRCPAVKWLTLKQRYKGDRIYQAAVSDCAGCALKAQCTTAQRRYVSRHAQGEAFERMAQRMQLHPEMMERRRSIVEHPFGNLKQWLFGNGRFLLRQLEGTKAEMALAVTAYNLKRAISVLRAKKMMQLMG